jgi:hypothetical protein
VSKRVPRYRPWRLRIGGHLNNEIQFRELKGQAKNRKKRIDGQLKQDAGRV